MKARVGRECSISRGGPDGTAEVHKMEKSDEEVTALLGVGSTEEAGKQQWGAAPGVRVVKSSEFRGE